MWITPTNHPEPLLVDDHSTAIQHTWSRHPNGSILRSFRQSGRVTTETLATHVMGKAPAGHVWKHRNGDRTDFRASNLIAMQPGRRTRGGALGYVGVAPSGQKFRAFIRLPGGPKNGSYLGLHTSVEEAARAVDRALTAAGLPAVNFPEP